MGRSKASSKKPQPRGVDFKKFKKKLGRKLPPPTNATNTEIKSKAIILPEQSVALDKEGLAVSKKGLTLKELLQQTSHHNVKVRRDALLGIRGLLLEFPTELKLHKNAIIEKLRERISDDDKVVRETLYQLFKTVIFPGCKEDIQGAPISLLMAYIFRAMTHLSNDVRFMAFKFLDLMVQIHPPAFFMYTDKVLDSYMDLLQKNQFNLEDKSKLRFALSALVRCLSLLPSNEREVRSSGQAPVNIQVLHAFERDALKDSTGDVLIIGKLKNLVPVLVNCFYGLMPVIHPQLQLDSHSFVCMLSILQSLDQVVQYVYEVRKYQLDLRSSMSFFVSTEIPIQDEKVPSSLLDRLFAAFPMQQARSLSKENDHYDRRYMILNSVMSRIFFTVNQYICPLPSLRDRFLTFVINQLYEIDESNVSDKTFYDKYLPSLVPFIPNLVLTVDDQEHHLLKAFTIAFGNCGTNSSMKMACLEAVEELLVLKQEILFSDVSNIELLNCQKAWVCEIGLLLNSLGNRLPSSNHAVLCLLLRLGQIGLSNSDLAMEYDKLQDELQKYYCVSSENGYICYGPFIELPKESQEISISCLYYFSSLKGNLLASLALCCLSNSLESSVVLRIMEVIHSSYEAGHVQLTDFISFLVTLLSQYEVTPEEAYSIAKKEANLLTFKSITGRVCSYLSQMGDPSLVSQILDDVLLDHISQKLPVDNTCALMAMLISVNSSPKRFSEKSIIKLGDIILSYMIDIALLFPAHEDGQMESKSLCTWHYYLLPCFFLLDRSPMIAKLLLDKMGSLLDESCELPFLNDIQLIQDHPRKIKAIFSILLMMSMDTKMRKVLSSRKSEIDNIFQIILLAQSSVMGRINFVEKSKLQDIIERMKNLITDIFSLTS
ncbi:uncharacterized protein LOC130805595 isoform X1 [Amaranthus tricolor]|uniref:uncharacterized protein LOC130805595 isoform X1 n=1 Tax=Amaranthus tricolor TaxID=29722 RepID=UPI002582FC0B|nr:uncharacterized protein LOC130805595 isoform X1 [Amaranthus tricolor]